MNKLNHLGVIADGNGRWAKARGMKRRDGHEEGLRRIDDMMHYKCSDIETGAILFSKEYGYLCETKGASKLLRRIKED